jgi:hypothetical protein
MCQPAIVGTDKKASAALVEAKESFKRILLQHRGDAARPEVKDALELLIQTAANDRGGGVDGGGREEWSPALNEDANAGRWRTITTPPFPGKLPDDANDDGKSRFTLGRMAFGLFKPTKLVCAVEEIVNVVQAEAKDGTCSTEEEQGKDKDAPAWSSTYNFEVLMEIETPTAKLPAMLTNHGVCFPKSKERLGVKFTRCVLEPRFDLSNPENATLAAVWKETFDKAIAKEAEAQSHVGRAGTWLMHKLMKMMMGLEPPIDTSDFTQTFTMSKPFVGHLDLLYLDDDFRISKGNRGTIVAVERLAEK